MMAGHQIAFVTTNSSFAETVQAHLGDAPLLGCSFEQIGDYLVTGHSDGLVVVAASSHRDVELILGLIQQIRQKQLTPRIVVLEEEQVPSNSLTFLDPYVTRRLRWPRDAGILAKTVRDTVADGLAAQPTQES